MIEKTPKKLLAEYKELTQPKPKPSQNWLLNSLPGLAGAYSAFHDAGRSDFVLNVAKEVSELKNFQARGLIRDAVRDGVKKPTIGLYCEYTSKDNLRLSWRPLNYGTDDQSEDFDFSDFYLGGEFVNELAFIRDLQYLNGVASTSYLGDEKAGTITCGSECILRSALAQKTIACLESILVKIAENLSPHYDVWLLNNISFSATENSNVKINHVDTPESIKMMRNALSNNSSSLKNNDYERISVTDIINIEEYREIKKNCEKRAQMIKDLNIDLKNHQLTSNYLVQFIKRFKRNPTRIAHVLSEYTKTKISKEQIISWVNKMYEADSAQANEYLGPKGAFTEQEINAGPALQLKINANTSLTSLKNKIANKRAISDGLDERVTKKNP